MNELYCGRCQKTITKSSLGFRVVKKLLSVVKAHSQPDQHHVYFDNFFTSHKLLIGLREMNSKATETVRPKRTNGGTKYLMADKMLVIERTQCGGGVLGSEN